MYDNEDDTEALVPLSPVDRDSQQSLEECLDIIGMGLAVIVSQINYEFKLEGFIGGISTTSAYIGMAIGAMYWGWISDIIGRRPAFMLTFFITAFFGFLAGTFHDIRLVSIMFGFMGLGIGGNLPIDGTLFLECIPASEQSLMTLLSLWWPIGQVMASVIAWIVLPSNSCDSMNCNPDDNWGWRYTTFILAFVTFAMSFSRQLFNLQESPKYLIARGRYEEAVEVLNYLALENGKVIHILPEDLMPDPNSRRQITERNHSTLFWFGAFGYSLH
ncbi:hypothetical protein HDV02_000894 [Globomyces sp. JEL0801]|nr:hypothetical protein HDV02_000894 [Globomyces sp. JEL0801]